MGALRVHSPRVIFGTFLRGFSKLGAICSTAAASRVNVLTSLLTDDDQAIPSVFFRNPAQRRRYKRDVLPNDEEPVDPFSDHHKVRHPPGFRVLT